MDVSKGFTLERIGITKAGLNIQVIIFNIYTISTLTKGDNLGGDRGMLILLNVYKTFCYVHFDQQWQFRFLFLYSVKPTQCIQNILLRPL